MSLVAVQTKDVLLYFGGNRLLLQGNRPRHHPYPTISSVSTGQDLIMVPSGVTEYSYQAVFSPPNIEFYLFYCDHILLFLFLFYFSITYLLFLVESRV